MLLFVILDFHLVQIHKLAVLSLSLHQHVEELALAAALDEAAEEHVRNRYTQGDADDGERCLDGIVHTYGDLAYHAVHVDEGKQGNTPGTIGMTLGMVMH